MCFSYFEMSVLDHLVIYGCCGLCRTVSGWDKRCIHGYLEWRNDFVFCLLFSDRNAISVVMMDNCRNDRAI